MNLVKSNNSFILFYFLNPSYKKTLIHRIEVSKLFDQNRNPGAN